MNHALRRNLSIVLVVPVGLAMLAGCAGESPNDPLPTGAVSPTANATQAGPLPEASDDSPVVDDGDLDAAAALDAYVKLERDAIPQLVETYDGVYSNIAIDPIYPSGVRYDYTYVDELDADEASAYFEGQVEAFQSLLVDQVFPSMAATGVQGPMNAEYVFRNPDGSVLWSKAFSE